MSKTNNYADDMENEFKMKVKKKKSKFDKHKKFIYKIVSEKNTDTIEDYEELYGYGFSNGKIKQR